MGAVGVPRIGSLSSSPTTMGSTSAPRIGSAAGATGTGMGAIALRDGGHLDAAMARARPITTSEVLVPAVSRSARAGFTRPFQELGGHRRHSRTVPGGGSSPNGLAKTAGDRPPCAATPRDIAARAQQDYPT